MQVSQTTDSDQASWNNTTPLQATTKTAGSENFKCELKGKNFPKTPIRSSTTQPNEQNSIDDNCMYV